MSFQFSEASRYVLARAGWTPDHKVDISTFKQVLEQEGYEVFEQVELFLKRYGGLKSLNIHEDAKETSRPFHFNPVKAVNALYQEKVEYFYESKIGGKLCVIGEAYDDHLILMMDKDGNIYGGYEEFLACIGHSAEEAIETLVQGKELKELQK